MVGEAAPSNPRTIKLLVDEKLHPEQPNKVHNGSLYWRNIFVVVAVIAAHARRGLLASDPKIHGKAIKHVACLLALE
jgi:hypothetical protein